MTHPTRAFSGSIINRLTGSKILARVGQISVAFPTATRAKIIQLLNITSSLPMAKSGNGLVTEFLPKSAYSCPF